MVSPHHPIDALPPMTRNIFIGTSDMMLGIIAGLPDGPKKASYIEQLCAEVASYITIENRNMMEDDARNLAENAVSYAIDLRIAAAHQISQTHNGQSQ